MVVVLNIEANDVKTITKITMNKEAQSLGILYF